jgi:hypothetical protein
MRNQIIEKLRSVQKDYQSDLERLQFEVERYERKIEELEEDRIYPSTEKEYELESWWESYVDVCVSVGERSKPIEHYSEKIKEIIEMVEKLKMK